MNTGYSKTLLRKGKAHGGHVHSRASRRKGATSCEEEAMLLAPGKTTDRPPHGAKMRSE